MSTARQKSKSVDILLDLVAEVNCYDCLFIIWPHITLIQRIHTDRCTGQIAFYYGFLHSFVQVWTEHCGLHTVDCILWTAQLGQRFLRNRSRPWPDARLSNIHIVLQLMPSIERAFRPCLRTPCLQTNLEARRRTMVPENGTLGARRYENL